MGKQIITAWQLRDGIHLCLMTDISEELNVVLISIWWLQIFRETLSVAVMKFDTERFDLKKLRNVGVKEESPIKISTTLTALEK